MSSPPPEAYDVARTALAAVHAERDVGITFGGAGLAATPRLGGHIAATIDMTSPAPAELPAPSVRPRVPVNLPLYTYLACMHVHLPL